MSARSVINEHAFESFIVQRLLEHGGYEIGQNERWSRELAFDRRTLLEFLQATQPDEWTRLVAIHGADVERRFLLRLHKELDNRGTLEVLRHGVIDYGVRFRLAFFLPATGMNQDTLKLYESNKLHVFRQLRYSQVHEHHSVDLVFTLNGLPIATVELKNQFTGQDSRDGRQQYIETRDQREPLFAFKRRALVHFVVDPDEAWMTTRLNGRDTRFLPFNQGHDDGPGNPHNPHGHRTAYLWEQIWCKDSWLDIIDNFAHLQQDEVYTDGRVLTRESLIFPRYHQLDVVRKLLANVKEAGTGKNYLIQHSAGSGKSNSISWLAHALASLHDANDQPVFDTVVVVTDRRVLDRQLQHTIYQFEHRQGVVVKIDRDSKQLEDALTLGAKIVITTLQKFPFVEEKIAQLPTRRYAVIVDEAHSSQSGEAAESLRGALAEKSAAYQVDGEELDYEDMISQRMEQRRATQRNMSFFAFTATPKPKTLAVFGTRGPDGLPHPFHLYSMRQAIEEGFILDVLQNYTTYEVYFQLSKRIENDPRLNRTQAVRAIAQFVQLHPHNVAQKVQVIIEHFRHVVMAKIGGQAKAMVVTSRRMDAVRYKQEFDQYIKEKGYTAIKALVAFSGSVTDEYDLEYTESQMNGFGERELPTRFAGDEYRLLIVADKYQTGFDQPLLHTMYVDKKLSNVRAVQTLSRLNRVYPGKDDTFVLDFANTAETIREAFQPFYRDTTIAADFDPNQLYDIQHRLDAFGVIRPDDIEVFAQVFFQRASTQTIRNHDRLNKLIDPAVTRWREQVEEVRDEFRDLLASFTRRYSFLAQIMPFNDAELEKLYAYARLLLTKLRDNNSAVWFRLQDEVALEYYRLQKISEGPITLERDGSTPLRIPNDDTTRKNSEDEASLSTIIDALNERFGTTFTQADQLFFDQIEYDLANNQALAQQARINSIDNFKFPFNDLFISSVIERMELNQDMTDRIMNEELFANVVRDLLLQKVYAKLRKVQQ